MVDETKRIPLFRQRKWRIVLVLVMVVLAIWGGLRWDRRRRALYRATILPSLGGQVTVAHAANERGQVVGMSQTAEGERRLVIWERGNGIQDLGPVCQGRIDINNDGWIAGTMLNAGGKEQAFIRDPNGVRTMLGTLGGPTSSARRINDKNQVVGVSEKANGVERAFVWDRIDGMVDLGTLGGASSWAKTINNAGLVFGYADSTVAQLQPFVWDPNQGMVAPPMDYTTDLNDESYAIGEYHFRGDGAYVVAWRNGQGMTRLFPLEHGLHNAPMINDAEQVVYDQPYRRGWAQLKAKLKREWFQSQWFLWDARKGHISIEQYMPNRLGEEFLPLGLNNKGCIAGMLTSKDQTRVRAVLLEPIAEKWEK